ncbi:MAG: DUF4652 domain-containing protein [Angelakisella sp.]|nr:DUF4652 domain-containing protein [Angelakisella sp.]
MNRILTVLLCVGLLFLMACGADTGVSGSSISTVTESSQSSSSGSTSPPASQSEQTSTPEPTVKEDYAPFVDFMTPGDFENFCLKQGYRPNTTVLSPDGSKLLFYRAEFEESTELWMVQRDTAPVLLLPAAQISEQDAVKQVMWYNNDTVLLIVGYRYGTVSPGGDVYRLDVTSKTLHLLYRPQGEREQVADLKVDGDQLTMEVFVYDEQYNHYEKEIRTIPLLVENAAVSRYYDKELPDEAAGLAVSRLEDPEAAAVEVMDLDESGEGILIIPRYVGSDIRLYSVKEVNGSFVNVGWLGAFYNTGEDYALRLNTILPEGMPFVKVVISCFDRHGEFLVSYDGRGETDVRIIK